MLSSLKAVSLTTSMNEGLYFSVTVARFLFGFYDCKLFYLASGSVFLFELFSLKPSSLDDFMERSPF